MTEHTIPTFKLVLGQYLQTNLGKFHLLTRCMPHLDRCFDLYRSPHLQPILAAYNFW